jgi:hypothetical protein
MWTIEKLKTAFLQNDRDKEINKKQSRASCINTI